MQVYVVLQHDRYAGNTGGEDGFDGVVEAVIQVDLDVFEDGDAVLADDRLVPALLRLQAHLLFVLLVFIYFAELDVLDLPVLLLLLRFYPYLRVRVSVLRFFLSRSLRVAEQLHLLHWRSGGTIRCPPIYLTGN